MSFQVNGEAGGPGKGGYTDAYVRVEGAGAQDSAKSNETWSGTFAG